MRCVEIKSNHPPFKAKPSKDKKGFYRLRSAADPSELPAPVPQAKRQ